jgi:hypothetical protein
VVLAACACFFVGVVAQRFYGEYLLGNGPQIACAEPEHDFGKILSTYEVVDHVFTLENTGRKPLDIVEVMPDCACSVATMPASVIPPGESRPLTAKLALAGFLGHLEKHVLVRSNDPQRPLIRLTLKANVESLFQRAEDPSAPVRAIPAIVNFGISKIGENKIEFVQLRTNDGKKLLVNSVACPSENGIVLREVGSRSGDDHKVYEVNVHVSEAGNKQFKIEMQTSVDGQPYDLSLFVSYYGTR